MRSWLVGNDGRHDLTDGVTTTAFNADGSKTSQTTARLFQVRPTPLTEELPERREVAVWFQANPDGKCRKSGRGLSSAVTGSQKQPVNKTILLG